jgi:hypothetical protein
MSEREKLLSLLFDSNDRKVLNIKFFRGNASDLTVEQLCAEAINVVNDTWSHDSAHEDKAPISLSERINFATI